MSLTDKTVKVRRGNVYLTVASELADRYIAKGFDVIDDSGNVLKQSVPNDLATLRAYYEQHTARIKELENKVAELEAQLKEKESKPAEGAKRTPKKKAE